MQGWGLDLNALEPRSGAQGLALPLALAAGLCALLLYVSAPPQPKLSFAGDSGELRAERSYGALPLAFEPNVGRGDPELDYVTHTSAGSVHLTDRGATLSLGGGRGAEAITLRMVGADPAGAEAFGRLPGVVNDLRGDDPARWETEIPTFERVRYPSMYPGIDLDWYGSQRRLEYDFRLAPHADPGLIAIRIAGADGARLAPNGDLLITASGETIRQRAPVAYQPAGPAGGGAVAERTPVRVAFVHRGDTIGFHLGPYDRDRPLVIDPLVLTHSTYLGGNADDFATAIAIDSTGAAYISGETGSTDFNQVGPIAGEGDGGDTDAFVSKLTPAGNALAYSTYLGGNARDFAEAIAVDGSGAAYVTGATDSTDFNQVGPIAGEGDGGGSDAFVSKLTPAGNALAYSTYLGGGSTDSAEAIAVDGSGAAYVTGETDSTDFNLAGPGQIDGDESGGDAFVSKLTPAGNALAYSTYLGGNAYDSGRAIAVDASGAAYVAGGTASSDLDTVGAIEGDSTSYDAFVSKLTPAGNALAYSTYLGGNAFDHAYAIAVDASGAAYATGDTQSSDFNTAAPIEGDEGGTDAFISKLAPAGNALAYSTYLGGNGDDFASAIAVDSTGGAYLAGATQSSDFNLVRELEGDSAAQDGFVSRLAPSGGALTYSTYLGGGNEELVSAITVDAAGAAYLSGDTSSSDFDTAGPIEGDAGGSDGFAAKLTDTDLTLPGPDVKPPQTKITKGPKRKVRTEKRRAKAKLKFKSNERGSSFECKLDGRRFRPCDSPFKKKVKRGRHDFRVRATDDAGNTDRTPAKHKWKVRDKR